MARYLCTVTYTTEGARGLIADGGTARKTHVTKLIKGMGGKVESFDFALGADDAYLIVDMPDVTDGAAISLAVAASGGARVRLTPLITAAQLDEAAKKVPAYRAPGA